MSDEKQRALDAWHAAVQLNSVQLNVVTVVDLQKAVATSTLSGALYMSDNSVGSTGRGTARLQTVCKPGQILNWIIYPMDMSQRPDKTWPPMPRIDSIVFLHDEGDVSEVKVCVDFKIYGRPDRMRSPYTPVYSYWAGAVSSTLSPGVYYYRFVVELEQDGKKEKLYLSTEENPSIKVLSSAPC